MRRRTTRIVVSLAAVIVLIAAVILAIFLRKRAAPETARLLPDADAFVYVNLKPLRTAGLIGQHPPEITDPEYKQFVEQTGFQFERDLDEAAFAVHLPEPIVRPGENVSPPDRYSRFSEIFEGHFDNTKVADYFRKNAANIEKYREVEIFSIPLEGRTVRIALLGVGTAAVSNTDGPSAIHGMIDRYKEIALPFGGPPLIRDYYHYVPLASLAWSIGRMPSSGPGQGSLQLPGGISTQLFLPQGTVVVTSVRYTGSVQIKAEALTQSEQQAAQVAEKANAFLSIFRGLEQTEQLRGPDPDVKAFFESLKVDQERDRAVLSATVPQGFIKKMLQEPPIGEAPLVQGQQAPPEPVKPTPKKAPGQKRH